MYIEFVRNLLLQSEASGKQKRLEELEAERQDRKTWRRTGESGKKKEEGTREADTKRRGRRGKIERSGGGEKRVRE